MKSIINNSHFCTIVFVKGKIVKDVTQLVLARRTRMCNFLEYKGNLNKFQSIPL